MRGEKITQEAYIKQKEEINQEATVTGLEKRKGTELMKKIGNLSANLTKRYQLKEQTKMGK